jgi:hypothetical protein
MVRSSQIAWNKPDTELTCILLLISIRRLYRVWT